MKNGSAISTLVVLALLSLPAARAQLPSSLDPTFGDGGKVSLDVGTFHNEAYAVAVQPDGKIVVAGNTRNRYPDAIVLARFTPSGALDPSFGTAGVVTLQLDEDSCLIRAIALQPDGKILLAGTKSGLLSGINFLLVRFDTDGTPDTSFDVDGWTTTDFSHTNDARSIAVQPDGKIIVAGHANREFDVYESDFAVARYNGDGSLDTTFDGDGKLITRFRASALGYSVAVQPDGKIVVGGDSRFAANTGGADFSMIRYNSDGSLDSTFGTGGKVFTSINNRHSSARSLVLLPNGQILLGGEAVASNNRTDFALARYNADGSLDTSFGVSGKVTTDFNGGLYDDIGETHSLAVQPNGKIILGGSIRQTQDNHDFALARYLPNGALDPSFGNGGKAITDFGSFGDFISAVTLQPDGRIVVAGRSYITLNAGTNLRYADFAVARYMGDLQLSAAASRKSHGSAGTFDLRLPISGPLAVEPRTSGGNHTVVISLNNVITSGSVSMTSGIGTISGSPSSAGNTLTVNLSGVSDGQLLTLSLSNVQDDLGRVLADAAVSFNVLAGDVSGNMAVNATDISQIKSQSGAPVTQANFHLDVTANGVINASDVGLVKSRSGAGGSSAPLQLKEP
jgi:uncharacterized delta-60 repeat protein